MSDHEMLDLVPLYALDALDGQEHRDFIAHLETCAECQSALDEYHSVTSELVADSPASEKTWELISVAIGTGDGGDSNLVELPDQRNNTWRWVAGVAAALALIFGALLAVENRDASQLTGDSIIAAAEQFADDPGSIVGDFLVDDVSVARVVLSADGRGFVIPTADLEPLDGARTYQLWVINDAEEVISAGVLGNNPEPATFTWTGDVAGFALTREVAGGVISSAGDVVSVITDV
jgi:anti-sigma-K factor RskA